MHPTHHFVVKRKFGSVGWGNLTEDCLTFDDAVTAVAESFCGNVVTDWPGADTVLVLEIDGHAALDRTADVLAACVARFDGCDDVPFAWSDLCGVAA